jgi:CheY-like chemotaxis protein
MIYLIDDKRKRQQDFGWSDNKFAQYSHILKPLYNIEDIRKIDDDLYSEKNIIIYHESFLDFTNDKYKAVKQREKLIEKAAETNELSLAFFSGSVGSRSLDENIATLPVSTLYQNLEVLVSHHNQGSVELKYLLFGENPEIEKDLDKLLTEANKGIDINPAMVPGKNLFIRPNLRNIQNAIEGANEVSIFPDVSDEKISEKLDEWLNITEYDNIFLPLCFGKVLSDYNGLRLATHIRCTPTINQSKRIFIYGFVGLDYLIENEYFNILKTKNIQLVSYSKKAFEIAANLDFENLKPEELSKEIKKIKLDPPLNYADSHSIANECAIHQWAKTIGCNENEELTRVFRNVQYNLYFKYLRTIYPISNQDIISSTLLNINFKGNPKVLLIDDEAEKGWYEIFAFLLGDLNKISTDYLGDDFKHLTSDEIVEKSINYIFDEDIDIVILDFRLSPSDFENKNPEEITSIKLLKKIKNRNPGIQVIIFSATNKILNLQTIQEAQADGFIFKNASVSSFEPYSISNDVANFISIFNKCSDKIFLKDFYFKLDELKTSLIPRKNVKKSNHPLPKDFVDETLKWLELSCEVLKREYSQSMITASFIFLFSVLENLSNRLINVDDPISLPINRNNNQQLYSFEFRGTNRKLKIFKEDENNDGFYRRTNLELKSQRNIPWKFKILNTLDFITNYKINENELSNLIKKRNDFIHANSTTGDIFSINVELLIFLNTIIYNGLIRVK